MSTRRVTANLSHRRSLGLAFAALTLVSLLATRPATAEDPWQFTLTPYLWLQGTNGDLEVRGRDVHLDDSFLDMLDSSDTLIGGFAHLEGRKDRFGFWIEGNYSYTSTEDELKGGIDTRVRTGLTILEAGGFYTLAAGDLDADRHWRIDALAGVRYFSFNAKVDLGPLDAEKTQDWVDPLLGIGGQYDLGKDWTLIAHGDIGGFGAGSDLTANLYGLVGYRTEIFGARVLSSFGYRGLYIDRSDGPANSANFWLHGPVLGLTFRF